VDDWQDAFVLLDTKLDVPLGRRWAWSNRVVLRFSNITVIEDDPQFNAVFSSGFTFKFDP
jgi:hypothetical protein